MRHSYRPRAHIPGSTAFGIVNAVAVAIREHRAPIRVDWQTADYIGITTTDAAEAIAWAAEARKLKLTVSNVPGEPHNGRLCPTCGQPIRRKRTSPKSSLTSRQDDN
jgi:hypothetical protein